jgi:hypothetical protein
VDKSLLDFVEELTAAGTGIKVPTSFLLLFAFGSLRQWAI